MENLSPIGEISEEYWIQALPLIFAELCDECGGLTVVKCLHSKNGRDVELEESSPELEVL